MDKVRPVSEAWDDLPQVDGHKCKFMLNAELTMFHSRPIVGPVYSLGKSISSLTWAAETEIRRDITNATCARYIHCK